MQSDITEVRELKGNKEVRDARRRLTTKRRTVSELSYFERRIVPAEFDARGPGSGVRIAEELNAQHSAVMEVVVHHLQREMRRVQATLVMRGCEAPERRPMGRNDNGLRMVHGETA